MGWKDIKGPYCLQEITLHTNFTGSQRWVASPKLQPLSSIQFSNVDRVHTIGKSNTNYK